MTAKQAIQDWVNDLSDSDTDWDEIREDFYVFTLIKEREESETKGEIISTEEMRERFKKCFL